MRHPLPLRVRPVDRETAPSFLARMAAANGVSSKEFAYDMGIARRRLIKLEVDAIQAICDLADLDPIQRDNMVSWTGTNISNVRMSFRNEVFVSRALRNPIVRGCPHCLREDAIKHSSSPDQAMALRGDWQFREVSICIKHKHPLMPLWTEALVSRRFFNMGERLAEIRPSIMNGHFDQAQLEASAFDHWLDKRLEDGEDQTWLATQTTFAASTFCRLLGFELMRLDEVQHNEHDFHRIRKAQAIGFDVASKGERAIKSALDSLASVFSNNKKEPRGAFASLYPYLDSYYLTDPQFDVFRRLLRTCILENWAIPGGTLVLGETLDNRLVHSLYSASLEIGVKPPLLKHFLIEAGAFEENDERVASRRLFNATKFQALLDEIPTLVGPKAIQQEMNATKGEFEALVSARILVPRTKNKGIKKRWLASDGAKFVAEWGNQARPVSSSDDEWEKIQSAQQRRKVRMSDLIVAIRNKKLSLGRRENAKGFQTFVVSKKEVNQFSSTYNEHKTKDLVTAASFGREIGIRDKGSFLRFMLSGNSPSILDKHPITGIQTCFMTAEHVQQFHDRFVTLTTLSAETEEHRNTILATLQAASVQRFAPNGEDFGSIYLRSEVEAAGYVIKMNRVSRK